MKGFEFSKYFVFLIISIMFLNDLVPDWTGIPVGLLITINFSEQELKVASKNQNEVIKDLTNLIVRIFNQINIS